jgi:hypothetical protein
VYIVYWHHNCSRSREGGPGVCAYEVKDCSLLKSRKPD